MFATSSSQTDQTSIKLHKGPGTLQSRRRMCPQIGCHSVTLKNAFPLPFPDPFIILPGNGCPPRLHSVPWQSSLGCLLGLGSLRLEPRVHRAVSALPRGDDSKVKPFPELPKCLRTPRPSLERHQAMTRSSVTRAAARNLKKSLSCTNSH